MCFIKLEQITVSSFDKKKDRSTIVYVLQNIRYIKECIKGTVCIKAYLSIGKSEYIIENLIDLNYINDYAIEKLHNKFETRRKYF